MAIDRGRLTWTRRTDRIHQEAQLDGFYVIRTSVAAGHLSAEDAVRHYKGLARVEHDRQAGKGRRNEANEREATAEGRLVLPRSLLLTLTDLRLSGSPVRSGTAGAQPCWSASKESTLRLGSDRPRYGALQRPV